MKWALLALVLVLACGGAPAAPPAAPVAAAPPERQPADLFERGVWLYLRMRYAEAARAFQAAYRERPDPNLIYDEAVCYEKLRERDRAADLFEQYLQARPIARDRPLVRERIEILRGRSRPSAIPGPENPATDAGELYREAFDYAKLRQWDRAIDLLEQHDRAVTSPRVRLEVEHRIEQSRREDPSLPADPFQRGAWLYQHQRYAQAAAAFHAAYVENPHPEMLYNEALCYGKLRLWDRETQLIVRYLRETRTPPEKIFEMLVRRGSSDNVAQALIPWCPGTTAAKSRAVARGRREHRRENHPAVCLSMIRPT